MEEVYGIDITPCRISEKSSYKTVLMSSYGEIREVDSSPLVNFKKNDCLFMGRMIGKGFIQLNYTKMDKEEIKKYFPKKPKDRFSKFAGTELFPNYKRKSKKFSLDRINSDFFKEFPRNKIRV